MLGHLQKAVSQTLKKVPGGGGGQACGTFRVWLTACTLPHIYRAFAAFAASHCRAIHYIHPTGLQCCLYGTLNIQFLYLDDAIATSANATLAIHCGLKLALHMDIRMSKAHRVLLPACILDLTGTHLYTSIEGGAHSHGQA